MIVASDERIASAELEHLARILRPPCQAGTYVLTGQIARSATALLYTARGPAFAQAHTEGVLKLTGSMYAPILRRELGLLLSCAAADIDNIVRPLSRDLVWLSAGGPNSDRPTAALPLPLLGGGDLTAVAARAARAGELGPELALQAARPIATALRALLKLLDPPVAHGDVRPQNVLLPGPNAGLDRLQLIDLDAAREVHLDSRVAEEASTLADDVRGFGELLCLLSSGDSTAEPAPTANRAYDALVRACLGRGDQYASMADERLWRDLEAAEAVARARLRARPSGALRWLRALRARVL